MAKQKELTQDKADGLWVSGPLLGRVTQAYRLVGRTPESSECFRLWLFQTSVGFPEETGAKVWEQVMFEGLGAWSLSQMSFLATVGTL